MSKLSGKRVADLPEACAEVVASVGLVPDTAVVEAVQTLVDRGKWADAVKLFAHALPKRESVWWACTCCRVVLGEGLLKEDEQAIVLAEQWVYEPVQSRARAAYAEAEKRGFQTAGAWTAVAAFWSGESLAPAGQPVVPPAAYLTGVAVAGAVQLAAVCEPLAQMQERYQRFVRYAHDVAGGGSARTPDGRPL